MTSLFSHAPEPEPANFREPRADVVETCLVPRETDEAFRGFHEYPHLWWPADFTAFGEGTHVEFEGGALVETSEEEETVTHAEVREIRPGELLELDWNPGTGSATVTISFSAEGAGTAVTITHTGFDAVLDGAGQREEAEALWRNVLQRYGRFMGGR
ncbi:SRPBCC domain-containing protein [Arthrobacter gandavensis]|uniref:SRPBCC domain-containing protein n=1 Tax=Arthrobacter gandavensis TaxID=169960 RepID=UPI00188E7EAC|nr:SRPBCC domain-containing protein [Arthrobacter gandavensis]MBF4993485.1 SRPBCC domain-containing protein [Arthrobacter gandavensis]